MGDNVCSIFKTQSIKTAYSIAFKWARQKDKDGNAMITLEHLHNGKKTVISSYQDGIKEILYSW